MVIALKLMQSQILTLHLTLLMMLAAACYVLVSSAGAAEGHCYCR
jgi:hypothetical protein